MGNDGDEEAAMNAIPEGLLGKLVKIDKDNCETISGDLGQQLEMLRQQKFLDPCFETVKPLKEAFEDQDKKFVTAFQFKADGGLELSHWTGGGGGNDYHWLLLKAPGGYVNIASGNDNDLEWGLTGLDAEDEYNESISEEEEDAQGAWLRKLLLLRYSENPDDALMMMEDDFEEEEE